MSHPVSFDELLDVRGLAHALGVTTSTVRSMKHRGQLPPPTFEDINGGAVWEASCVREIVAQRKPATGTAVRYIPDTRLPRVVDLFAGCGGLSLGLQTAGFDVVAGLDNWDPALEVYRSNFDHPVFKQDLADVEGTISVLEQISESFDIIAGGPPCQDFSSAGKRVEADRADLTIKFASIVSHFMPQAFIMENVERAKSSMAFSEALSVFRSAGYGLTVMTLDASRCGVPQSRKRLFTIGVLGAADGFLDQLLLSAMTAQPTTVRDHFGSSLGVEHYYRHPRSYARRAIFSIDEPAPTIRGVNRPVAPGYPGHPGDTTSDLSRVRALTTRERALLQTFPEDFYFGKTKTSAEQMIGNAVPVGLGAFVGRALAAYLAQHRAGGAKEGSR